MIARCYKVHGRLRGIGSGGSLCGFVHSRLLLCRTPRKGGKNGFFFTRACVAATMFFAK